MPANNLQFTANFKTVNSTLTYELIRGKNNLKDVYFVFPTNHKGIVYLFHGSNGSTSSWTGNQENKNLIKDLIADGYAVVITESEEETLNTDINGDGSLRWDASTLDSNLNVDFANLKAITDTFYNRGYTNRSINRYCLGQSNGGSFSISFGYLFNLKASIAYCSSGGATGGAVNITTTPTMFCLAGADNNSTMGLTGNANAISNSQSISSRGVCSKYYTNNASPLYNQRFARNSIISSTLSTQVFNEIKNNNFLNTKNYFIGYIQSLWNAVAATPQNFPVISALSTSQKNVVEEQIRCVTADHQFYSEYNKSAIQFFNYQCQPQLHSTLVTQCDSYSWSVNGITYTTSGSYTSVIGCHIEILNLTINASTHNKTTASSCTSYTWSRNAVTYSTSGTYVYTYTNGAGCASADTLKLTIKQKSSSTTTISNCVSYLWNGVTYTASGSYTKTGLTNAVGCDSTAYLSLTIKQPTTSSTTISNCVSYLWNGVTYTASGSYTKTGLTNAVGCDSSAILSLTIKQPTTSSTTISNCVSYLWNGVTYTASGSYTKTGLMNSVGCDSSAVLSLTIKQPTFASQIVGACNSYTWSKNGNTYTSSGVYVYNYTNTAGCASADTLKLTINTPTNNVTTIAACDSYVWSRNGQTYYISGTYVYAYTNTSGCSSSDTLKLTINNSTHIVTTATSCNNYTWANNGATYTNSGTYVYSYSNTAGCASSDTLKLTIKNSTSSSFTASGCNSYVLPWGTSVTTTGQYTYNYTSTNGCDSLVTANITINQSKISNTDITLCSSQLPYLWNGTNYNASGSYTYNTTTTQVCDSVAVLNLVVNNTSSSTTNIGVCNSSLPYDWNGTAYTTGGTYSKIFTNAVSCDSIAFLVLTVSTTTPGVPTALTQTLVSNVCGARVYRYTVTAVTNATGYSWTLPTAIGGISGVVVDSGNANSSRVIRIRYSSNAAALTTDSIFVRAFSGCGTSATKSFKLTNTVLTVPSAPASITITAIQTNVCANRIYRYTAPVLPVATTTASAATGYVWSFVGTLGTNAVVDSGSLTSRIVRMKFTSNVVAATGDSAKVLYTSACGNSLNKALKLTNAVLNVPAAPASITVTAIQTNVCGSRVYRYVAPNLPAATTTTGEAKGYLWSFKGSLGANAVIDSGSTSSQKIVVRYSSNLASAVGDSVKVLYTSDCGNSLNRALKLSNTLLVTPTPVSITMTLVSDVCGARVYRYAAADTTLATTTAPATKGWQWSMPVGVVGSTGSLDSGTLNSRFIKIRYTSNAAAGTGDSIKVAYVSDCGVGANKAVKLSNAVKTGCPVTPVNLPITKVYFIETKKYLANLR